MTTPAFFLRFRILLIAIGSAVGMWGCGQKPLFQIAQDTQITFKNQLTESEQLNILSYEYFYNGGGVAAGDFNNDGLTDLYFSGNQVPNELYLNRGEMRFEAVKANVEGRTNAWKTGVAVVDINQDGWLDIYQCYSGIAGGQSRKNQLFVNQGARGGKWLGKFAEEAERYGIADAGYSTHAAFLDYDLDGDLDLFVLNHNLKNYQRKEAALMKSALDSLAGDRLYRNNDGRFEDVTLAAGIKSNPLGFGLGVVVADFNQDNRPDLYVANDYVEEDYLYLNNGNATFNEVGKEAMGHFSYSAMGVDAADINNDGLPDLFTADMLPEDNARQKLLAFPDNWNVQLSMLDNGFHWQNMRNMLQVNLGTSATKPLAFAELGQLAGVAATDWSWAPLLADLDNDGLKDLFVSNGFVRDLTDLDFVKYYLDQEAKAKQNLPTETLLNMVKQMPSTPTHHYVFRNNGDLTFSNQVKNWGFEKNTIGCGAIYADLDNDGDLDLVTNNTNEPACIYRNHTQERNPANFLKIKLEHPQPLGSKVWVYAGGGQQFFENNPTHGFQSSVSEPLHVGLGQVSRVDSVKVVWPDGGTQTLLKPTLNQTLRISYAPKYRWAPTQPSQLFERSAGVAHTQSENAFIDFNRQVLLPKLYSRHNPRFASADINADGLADVLITTPSGQATALYLQKPDGGFGQSPLTFKDPKLEAEDVDAVWIDADRDRDLDLYLLSGSYEQTLEDQVFRDRFFLNDGKGHFSEAPNRIPVLLTNKSVVKAVDIDQDGDQDLFVGGNVRAGLFPYADPSYLLRNDGGTFVVAQKLELGIVTDVAIADLNQDRLSDVVIVGEWLPVAVLYNQKGQLSTPAKSLVEHSEGWYGRIKADDLDQDGDLDLIVGNLGLNTPLRASAQNALLLRHGDADDNGMIDLLMGNPMGDQVYPTAGRDELLEQSVFLKRKYTNYQSYAKATFDDLLEPELSAKMQTSRIHNLESGILWNESGTFEWMPLPPIAQASPIYAIEVADFNHDGHKDLLLAGNESNFRIRIGKTDANAGLVLLGKPKRVFVPLNSTQTGLFLRGDVRDILSLGTTLWFGLNNQPLQVYRLTAPSATQGKSAKSH